MKNWWASRLTLISFMLFITKCRTYVLAPTKIKNAAASSSRWGNNKSNHLPAVPTQIVSRNIGTATATTPLSMIAAPAALGLSNSQTSSTSAMAAFSTGGGGAEVSFRNIGKEEMTEILEDYKEAGREESQYCIIDVRTDDEVFMTGKLAESVPTLPIQLILQANAFAMDEDDFEDAFGFEKPRMDETLVFSCAAGVRSVYACQAAAAAGYSNLINYVGGSNEWFG